MDLHSQSEGPRGLWHGKLDMHEKYTDFDAYWREISKPPLVFKACGTEYRIPGSLPAETGLKIIRVRGSGGCDSLTSSELAEIARRLLGREQFEDLNSRGITASELGKLTKRMLSAYREQGTDRKNSPSPPLTERRGE